MSATKL